MKKSVIFLFVIVLFFCNGCSNSIVEFPKSVLGVNFDGNVKLVKEDITVTKADYMNDNSYSKKYQNYEICIPYRVEGEVKKDIKEIPVRYTLEMELGQAIGEMTLHAEQDAMYKVMESSFTIEEGSCDGYILLQTDYNAMAMQGEPDSYPYIWIAIQLEDDDNSDDYLLIYNPYFQNEDDGIKTKGDIWIEQENIKIEKGKQEDGIQHYNLSFFLDGQRVEDVKDKELSIGADFFFTAPTFEDNVSNGYDGAFCFQEGLKYGFVDKIKIDDIQGKTQIILDVYNRFADETIGYDIDYYPYLWIALDINDSNRNNNYDIVKNPFFNENNSPPPYEEVYKQLYYMQEPLENDV